MWEDLTDVVIRCDGREGGQTTRERTVQKNTKQFQFRNKRLDLKFRLLPIKRY